MNNGERCTKQLARDGAPLPPSSLSPFSRVVMSNSPVVHRYASLTLLLTIAVAACGGSDSTGPGPVPETLQLSSAQVTSLDSSAQVILQANPGNSDLKSLVDSTLLVLTAGIQAKHIDVSTNLSTAPLYFVGIHRTVRRPFGSYSTWTIVGFDDPSHLANLVEVSGFAQTTTADAPTSVNGTIGDGTGIVNAMLLQVGAGGTVTQWRANSGNASFASDAPGAACPGFTANATVTCSIETLHVHFTANAASGSGGAGARQAAVTTDVDVPTMRLSILVP
jgi:hypothetical protein